MTMEEATTPRASLESSILDSSRDNVSSTTGTLLHTSSVLLSHFSLKSLKEQKLKPPKLLFEGCTHAELNMNLKTKLKSKLELEAERHACGLTCTSMPVQQHLCMNMLSNGKPKSFIEFFNLIHSGGSENICKGQDAESKILSPEDLSCLSAKLVEAELAMRNGDFQQLSHINFEIANIFDNSGHHHKAIFYLLRSLKNSKQAEDGSHEAKVKFSLGKVNVKLGAYSNAITWFEEYLDFTKDNQDNEGLVLGSRQLLEVYELFAKRARCKGQLHKGLELYQKSIDMAEICGDERAKAEAKHQIGHVHQKLSQFELALQYHTEFLEFCCSNNDEVGRSKAYAALAKTRESMGDIELAVKHLEALLEVSQHVNMETQATACCKLGMMYSKQHAHDKALLYFEMFFKLACSLKDPKLVDAARLNLGYVRNVLNLGDAISQVS